jgi:hypothetical protein
MEDFFHWLPVSTTPVVHLELRIFPQIFKKFDTALIVNSGAWGNLIHEKTRSRKSRDTVPFSAGLGITTLYLIRGASYKFKNQ